MNTQIYQANLITEAYKSRLEEKVFHAFTQERIILASTRLI